MGGGNYQQLINEALLEYIEQQGESFEDSKFEDSKFEDSKPSLGINP